MADYVAKMDVKDVMEQAKVLTGDDKAEKVDVNPATEVNTLIMESDLFWDQTDLMLSRRQLILRIFLFAVFYLLLITSMLFRYPLRHEYSAVNGVTYRLQEPFLTKWKNDTILFRFKDIYSFVNFWDWFEGPLTDVIGVRLDEAEYSARMFQVAGRVRLRTNRIIKQDRATTSECGGKMDKKIVANLESWHTGTVWCYPRYSKKLEQKAFENFPYSNSGVHSAYYYKSDDRFNFLGLLPLEVPKPYDNDISSISGHFASYAQGGFMIDLDPRDENAWMEAIDVLGKNSRYPDVPHWIDKSTRLVSVEFSVLNPNLEMFVSTIVTLELDSTGQFMPIMRTTTAPTKKHATVGFVFDIFLFLCILEMVVFHAKLIFSARRKLIHDMSEDFDSAKEKVEDEDYNDAVMKNNDSAPKPSLKQIFFAYITPWNAVDILVITSTLTLLGFNASAYFSDRIAEENFQLYSNEGFLDRYDVGYIEGMARIVGGLTLICLTMRMYKYAAINKQLRVMSNTAIMATPSLARVLFIFFSLLLTFALLGHGFFGRSINEFGTYSNSIVTLFMMAYGNADLPHLLTYFPVLAPTFMLVFVVLFYFFLLRSLLP